MKKPSIKKPNIKNILPKWSSKNIRKGSYSLGISVVVLAIAVVFNLVVGKLPSQYRNVDLSQTKLSTIGDTTKELVSNLDQDVTIYQIAESGSENETIQKLLERYEGLSSHVKVETMDPVLHPNFVSEYTDDDLASNSLIVVGERTAARSFPMRICLSPRSIIRLISMRPQASTARVRLQAPFPM